MTARITTRIPGDPGESLPLALVLTRGDDSNCYAAHLAEQLRMEGLNWLVVRDLETNPLRGDETLPPLVVAGAVDIDGETAHALAAYVAEGGALLAARPAGALTVALGLPPPIPLGQSWVDRYVALEPTSPLATSLPWAPGGVQYAGPAFAYAVNTPNGPAGGAASGDEAMADSEMTVHAWLVPFPHQPVRRYPALLTFHRGRGRVAILAYDPAESAVRQQQGRPEQASTGALPDLDGDGAFRPNDLFVGQLDPGRRDVPQADLHRTLLLRAVEWLTEDRPIPRLWRFPDNAPALAFLDGDSDGMSREDFQLAIATSDRYRAPFATYLKPEHLEVISPAEERELRGRGHSFGPHPWAGPMPDPAALRAVLEEDCAVFADRFGYRPRIHRGHWLIWPGWVDHARSLAGAGIRLDANFAAGRSFQGGYVNGTGLPAYFVDEAGATLDIFEQSTISTDDGWLADKSGLPPLTLAGAITRSYAQIDSAIDHYHTVYHPYFHPVLLKGGRALPYPTLPWMEAVLAHCQRRGLPFLDAERWVDWNDARRAATLGDYHAAGQTNRREISLSEGSTTWDGAGLASARLPMAGEQHVRFTIRAAAALQGVSVLLPIPEDALAVSATADGQPIGHDAAITVYRHGRRYVAITRYWRSGEAQHFEVRWTV